MMPSEQDDMGVSSNKTRSIMVLPGFVWEGIRFAGRWVRDRSMDRQGLLKENSWRFYPFSLLLLVAFGVPMVRLVQLGIEESRSYQQQQKLPATKRALKRPDIVDRNGVLLALDLPTRSMWANPRQIIDIDEAVDGLVRIFPQKNRAYFHKKLSGKGRFVWLHRNLTPLQEQKVLELGLPGVNFLGETHRAYPAGHLAPHILGYVNIDNQGQAGIEKYLDERAKDQQLVALYSPEMARKMSLEAVELSIDVRVQYAMRRELEQSMALYRAKAAAGLLMDIHSGEVISMVSLPDFDSVSPSDAQKKENINRISRGLYELGSILKVFTSAIGLENFGTPMRRTFDVRTPIKIGGYKIRDLHGPKGYLTLPEIFIHSSNIGSARIVDAVGGASQREFLERMGLLRPVITQIGKVTHPLLPRRWKRIQSMTISYGHGISLTPLQFATAAAPLFNGGYAVQPSFQKRKKQGDGHLNPVKADEKRRVLDESISRKMRILMRLNVMAGTGRGSDVPGYDIGGKTGTADKAVAGRYGKEVLTSFVSIFPSKAPRYLMLILFDEPQSVVKTRKVRTASVNAVPATKRLVPVIAGFLGIRPNREKRGESAWFRKEDYLRPKEEVGKQEFQPVKGQKVYSGTKNLTLFE